MSSNVCAFSRRQGVTADDPHPGWPVSAQSNENVEKAHATVMQDRQITTRLLAEHLEVGKEAVARQILERNLQQRNIFFRSVPHSLTAEHRQHQVEHCRSFIEFVDQDRNILLRIVTGDES
jgi:hypothetical protein